MLDIVIVNWNSKHLVRECVASILNSSSTKILNKIILIDNASTDKSLENLPISDKLICIQNSENKGFSYACNQGFKSSTATYCLLLNPDARVYSETILSSYTWMEENKDTGILGVQLLDQNNSIAVSCARFPTPLHFFYDATGLSRILPKVFTPGTLMLDWDHTESKFVNQVSGAYMFIRSSVFKTIGYFDERFFVYFEELDFSKRYLDIGGKIFFNSSIRAFHEGKGTTESVKAFRLFLFLRSKLQYGKKHFSFFGFTILLFSVFPLEFITRLIFGIINGSITSSLEVIEAYVLLFKWKLNKL